MNRGRVKLLVVTIWMLATGVCYSCQRREEVVPLEQLTQDLTEVEEESQALSPSLCYIHICGQVNNPGVYELKQGDRIFQAIEAAGGFTPQADTTYLNLAETVRDGMQLTVPAMGQELSQGQGDPVSGQAKKVNINTATMEQLMTLTGIGQARAEDIIRYRQEHGAFLQIEDIMLVSGIKEAAFQKIRDDITVNEY